MPVRSGTGAGFSVVNPRYCARSVPCGPRLRVQEHEHHIALRKAQLALALKDGSGGGQNTKATDGETPCGTE